MYRWTEALGLSLDLEAVVQAIESEADVEGLTRDLRRMGFEQVTTEEALLARLIGLDVQYVKEIQHAGLCGSVDEMVRMKVAGINGGFIRSLKAKGHEDLSADDVIALRRRVGAREERKARPSEAPSPVVVEGHAGFGFELR